MEENKKKSNITNIIVLVGIIIVLIIIIGALGYLLVSQKSNYEDEIKSLKRELKSIELEQTEDEQNDNEKNSNKSSSREDEKDDDSNKNSKTSTTNKDKVKEEKIYDLGETWTVNDQWKLTINSVTSTSDRNQFSDKNPAQVVIITYTYENIGYEDNIMDGLYINIGNSTVVDANGEIADSYPGSITNYPKEIPVGAKCVDAQGCIALNNVSDYISLTFSMYDEDSNKQVAKFNLKVD